MWRSARVRNAPGEIRTPDALLRTEALYPLSYGGSYSDIITDCEYGGQCPGLDRLEVKIPSSSK